MCDISYFLNMSSFVTIEKVSHEVLCVVRQDIVLMTRVVVLPNLFKVFRQELSVLDTPQFLHFFKDLDSCQVCFVFRHYLGRGTNLFLAIFIYRVLCKLFVLIIFLFFVQFFLSGLLLIFFSLLLLFYFLFLLPLLGFLCLLYRLYFEILLHLGILWRAEPPCSFLCGIILVHKIINFIESLRFLFLFICSIHNIRGVHH